MQRLLAPSSRTTPMSTTHFTGQRPLAIVVSGLLGASLVSLCAVSPAAAQRSLPTTDPAGGGKRPPPLPVDTVESLLTAADREAIRGIVEELVARKLTTAPPVGIVEPGAMRLAAERAMRASKPDAVLESTMLNQLAQRLVALYDPGTKSIFIGSGGLAAVGASDRRPVLCMLFAQALVHAVLDQEVSLGSYTNGATPEVSLTRRMLTEGLAVTVRDRVGARLGFNAFFPAYRPHLPGMIDSRDGASLERSLYGTGRLVVESKWNAEGIEAVWSLIRAKPSAVRELALEIPRSKAIVALQATLEPILDAKEWHRARSPVAPSVAVSAMKGLTDAERGTITARCVATETLGYSRTDGAAVLISMIRMVDDSSMGELAAALSKMPATLEAELRSAGARPQVVRSDREIGGVAFQVSSVTLANDESARPTTIVEGKKGREMSLVTLSGAVLSADALDKVLAAIAAHLGAPSERRAE